MAALELIEQLEEWGVFNASIIEKLRAKVAQAPSEPTAEAVLNYLVKKKIITQQKGAELLDRYLNDPGQDSAALLQTDLLSPSQGLSDGGELEELEELEDFAEPIDDEPMDAVPLDMDETRLDQGQYLSDPVQLPDAHYAPPGFENQAGYGAGAPGMAEAAAGWNDSQTAGSGGGASHSAFSGKITKGNPWEGMWLWVGAGMLIFFSAVAVGLSLFLNRLSSDELWNKAEKARGNHNFSEAKLRYSEFVTSFPTHDLASEARVQAAMCDIHIPFRSNDFAKALERAEEILPTIQDEMGFNSARGDLADILPRMGDGLAEIAKKRSDQAKKKEDYDLAVRAQTLVGNSSYITSKMRTSALVAGQIAEMNEKIAVVDRQLTQEENKDRVLVKIRGLIAEDRTAEAFEEYRQLKRDYPALMVREEVRAVRDQIAERELGLVVAGPLENAMVNPDVIPSTLAVASRYGDSVSLSDSDVVSVLVDGALYALQGRDGRLLWRRYVGFEYDYLPAVFPEANQTHWLVSQGRDQSIVRVDAVTGEVKWKFLIGEDFTEPVLSEEFVLVTTKQGRVLKIDSATGRGLLQCQLPQGVSSSPALGANNGLVYQVGDHWYLYVLDANNLSCKEVFLLDHEAGAVVNPPVSQLGLLYVAESRTTNSSIHVLRAEERGWKFENAQAEINFDGRLQIPMLSYGRDDVLVVDDRGNVSVLSAIGDENERPVMESVKMNFDPSPNIVSRAVIAKGGDFYVNGRGLYRYQLRKQMQDFERKVAVNSTDVYLAPPRVMAETLITVRRRNGSAIVSVTALDRESLEMKWQTDLGAPLAGTPFELDGKIYVINNQGDQFRLDSADETQMVTDAIRRGSTTGQSLQFNHLLVDESGVGMVNGPGAVPNFMIFDQAPEEENNRSRTKLWEDKVLPLAVNPVKMRQFAVVSSAKGEVFLVDFKTGTRSRTGFQPELPPGKDVQWLAPSVLSDEAVFCAEQGGSVYRLRLVPGGFAKDAEALLEGVRLLGQTQTLGGQPLVAGRRADAGGTVDQLIRLGDDLSETGDVSLPADLLNGPWVSGDQILVETVDGQWLTFDANLQPLGTVDGSGLGPITGTPVLMDGAWYVVTRLGNFVRMSGNEATELGAFMQPLKDGPVSVAGKWMATTPDGSILILEN